MALLGRLKIKESRWTALEKKRQRNGLRHTIVSPNGDLFTGEWKDDLRHGQGTQVWKKLQVMFEGEWKRGKRHGSGTLYKLQPSTKEPGAIVFSGTWKDDKKHGFGKFFFSSSSWFEGEWEEDKRNGWGKMVFENGDVFEGEWLRDKPHGRGVLLLKNGDRFEGYMKEGKKHGKGCFFFKDKGQVLEGFWEDDMMKHGTLSDIRMDTAEPCAAGCSSSEC